MTQLAMKQQVAGHFLVHWGVPKDLHLRRPLADGLDLAIMEFPPGSGRKTHRFATNGMSGIAQQSGEGDVRTELYACSRGSHPWIVELLDALARYPMRHHTCFREHDTISVGPIDRDRSPFTAILLAPPSPEEKDTLGAIATDYAEATLVHQVVGIFDDECEFAIEEGGEELWRRLSALRAAVALDAERKSVA
jgi:hypothetical protein